MIQHTSDDYFQITLWQIQCEKTQLNKFTIIVLIKKKSESFNVKLKYVNSTPSAWPKTPKFLNDSSIMRYLIRKNFIRKQIGFKIHHKIEHNKRIVETLQKLCILFTDLEMNSVTRLLKLKKAAIRNRIFQECIKHLCLSTLILLR